MKTCSIQPSNWQEARRFRAWDLSQQGWKQKDIATALGVTEGAVSQWLSKARKQGPESLRRHPPAGAQPRLTAEQRAQLPALLDQGAEAFGFRGQVWTTARVAQLIKAQFGVQYTPTHCGRLLRTLRYSPQKPTTRATQRNEAAIAQWHQEDFPALKKRPKTKNARSSS
jgi:transposase